MKQYLFILTAGILLLSCTVPKGKDNNKHKQISGIYPHLAYYNNEGECGTGAVVTWADRLWVITYSPHKPNGSSDKLYEITPGLEQIVRDESIGGTPANRMIHNESKQLFIGPYAIDQSGNVRTIPYSEMPGRHTGNARHLTDPAGKIYYGTMEEGFYEVDVNTLQPTMLYRDGNNNGRVDNHKDTDVNPQNATLPGAHGKGLYSGQGVMVFSNNGEASPLALKQFDIEAGVLAEWDGKKWKTVRRNQFVEVTGPGGIYGNSNPETDPIWATGWDHKSVLLGVRNPETGWDFFRLPKASHSYDGAHGWNTEWPRIRDIGIEEKPEYLMTMHGMFWHFPETFTAENSAGIRPRSAYLKVIGDFTRWNGQLVLGCDDSAQKEFLNKRKQKGNIEGPGQSNSNLWFTSLDKPDQLGPNTAEGAVCLSENIKAGEASEPFLFAGWAKRCAWIKNEGENTVQFTFETNNGNKSWTKQQSLEVNPGATKFLEFDAAQKGEWIRVSSDMDTKATIHFSYADNDERSTKQNPIFAGLTKNESTKTTGGLLYGLGDNRRKMGIAATAIDGKNTSDIGYYELDACMNLVKKDDQEMQDFIKTKFAIPENVVSIEESSVLIVDDKNRRWRLPLSEKDFTTATNNAQMRICREVATERDLFNCAGTFYELPAENADGFAKIRPVSSHGLRIHDYASYRGLLVMTGLDINSVKNREHIVVSDDGKAAVWAGVIDDLWTLGKPCGIGGPWKNTAVKAGVPSDPYLIGFYDQKTLEISHNKNETVTFKIEVEHIGHGPWMVYKTVKVKAGETYQSSFPENFQSRWIRFVADKDCRATTWLEYK